MSKQFFDSQSNGIHAERERIDIEKIPESLEAAEEESRRLGSEISSMCAQLGDKNRTVDGRRVDNITYHQWRSKVLYAKSAREQRRAFLKEWIRKERQRVKEEAPLRRAEALEQTQSAFRREQEEGARDRRNEALFNAEYDLTTDLGLLQAAFAVLIKIRQEHPEMLSHADRLFIRTLHRRIGLDK